VSGRGGRDGTRIQFLPPPDVAGVIQRALQYTSLRAHGMYFPLPADDSPAPGTAREEAGRYIVSAMDAIRRIEENAGYVVPAEWLRVLLELLAAGSNHRGRRRSVGRSTKAIVEGEFMRNFFSALVAILSVSAFGVSAAAVSGYQFGFDGRGDGWRLVRKIPWGNSSRQVDLVVIDKARELDKNVYWDAWKKLCSDKDRFCKVMFWSEPAFVPKSMPMTPGESWQLKANFTRNGTVAGGSSSYLWSCNVEPDPNQCFSPH